MPDVLSSGSLWIEPAIPVVLIQPQYEHLRTGPTGTQPSSVLVMRHKLSTLIIKTRKSCHLGRLAAMTEWTLSELVGCIAKIYWALSHPETMVRMYRRYRKIIETSMAHASGRMVMLIFPDPWSLQHLLYKGSRLLPSAVCVWSLDDALTHFPCFRNTLRTASKLPETVSVSVGFFIPGKDRKHAMAVHNRVLPRYHQS